MNIEFEVLCLQAFGFTSEKIKQIVTVWKKKQDYSRGYMRKRKAPAQKPEVLDGHNGPNQIVYSQEPTSPIELRPETPSPPLEYDSPF